MGLQSSIRNHPLLSASALLLLIVIGAARIYLPYYVHDYVESTLNKIPDYQAKVGAIGVDLWRGAYSIEHLNIKKRSGAIPVPFFESSTIDLAIQWRELFRGALVGEINLEKPRLHFVTAEERAQSQTEMSASFTDRIRELFPLRINHVGIRNGQVHFQDFQSEPQIDVLLQQLNGVIINLTNSQKLSKTLVASAEFSGRVERSGRFHLTAQFDPNKKQKTFDGAVKIEELQARELNDFLNAYGNFDAEKGVINIYAEASASNNRIKGYLKPLVHDLHLLRWRDDDGGILHYLWEGLLSGFFEIFKNQQRDQLATIVHFSGDLRDPETNLWDMLRYFFSNGLFRALKPGLENSFDLNKVREQQ